MTSQLAGIHATIKACLDAGMNDLSITSKLVLKYGIEMRKALALVVATRAVVEG